MDDDDVVSGMTPVSRSVLEATARVIGPQSAAAQALASADSHNGETKFFRCGTTILVQKKAPATSKWN
jgi:hypothetical protein